MNNPIKPLSNRSLAKLLVTALVLSLVGTLISFDQLGGFALFTGHAVTDQGSVSEDAASAGIPEVVGVDSSQSSPVSERDETTEQQS